jgi:hypothetical protein
MSKILQIRRGSAQANNNFTGLPGEITLDTDASTIRIHDGQTIGGVPLARADQIGTGGGNGCNCGEDGGGGTPFDIESVSPEFWSALFSAHNLRPARFLESKPSSVGNVSYLETIFSGVSSDTDLTNAYADCVLVCQTPEAGYSIGDVVRCFGIGSRTNPCPNLLLDPNGLRARLLCASENFWVSHKTSGSTTNITNANWKIQFRVLFLTLDANTTGGGNNGENCDCTPFDIASVPTEFWENLFAVYGGSEGGGTGIDLSSKANTDLSNLSAPVENGGIFTGPDIVVEWATGLTGAGYINGWYRKYKSGWVEMGGESGITSNSDIDVIVTYPITLDRAYVPMVGEMYYTYLSSVVVKSANILEYSAAGFKTRGKYAAGGGSLGYEGGPFAWEVKGMAA